MRVSARVGRVLAASFILATSGCAWVSGWFERPQRSSEINHPGADVTFGIKRDQPAKSADAGAANQAGATSQAGATGTAGAAGGAPALDPAARAQQAEAGTAKATPLDTSRVPPGTTPPTPAATGAGGAPIPPVPPSPSQPAATPAEKEITAATEPTIPPPPAAGPGAVLDKTTLQGDAIFNFGKSDETGMLPGGKQKLDALAERIKNIDSANIGGIEVIGHADRLGSRAANQRLSERRAATVANYLVSKGVESSLINAVGKGDSEPVVQCKGKSASPELIECLAPNRRVDVVIRGK